MTRRGRRTALIAALGALCLPVLALFSWRDFAVRYQVHRLRRDPERLLLILDRPEESIEAEALRKFLATERFPGEAVFRAYLSELEKPKVTMFRVGKEEAILSIDSRGTRHLSWAYVEESSKGGGSMAIPGARSTRLKLLQDLLASRHFTSSDAPGYPEAVFSFHEKGEKYPEGSVFRNEDPPPLAYCLVRRKAPPGSH
jgi:hypothetical protein